MQSAETTAPKPAMGRRPVAVLALAVACGALTGCAMNTYRLPERYATTQEAFASDAPPTDPDVARQAVIRQVFDAPYEDVFRAVLVAASQALFQIDAEDKRRGRVLASESVRRQPSDPVHTAFYYAILARELGPKRTSVTVMTKVQYPCIYQESGAGWHIATLGAATVVESGGKEKCERLSALRWAALTSADSGNTYPFSPNRTPEVQRFLGFVRNNLLAAGAL